MDLALAFGDPYIGRHMPEADFADWRSYIDVKGLPLRRIELYLAQIAKFIVQTMGGSADAETSDFLFDRHREDAAAPSVEPDQADPIGVDPYDD